MNSRQIDMLNQAYALDRIRDRFEYTGFPPFLDVGPGWFPLIIELDELLSLYDPAYTLQQVKEKFGGLRWYFEPTSYDLPNYGEMRRIVSQYESLSMLTRELCGRAGDLRTDRGRQCVRCSKCDKVGVVVDD